MDYQDTANIISQHKKQLTFYTTNKNFTQQTIISQTVTLRIILSLNTQRAMTLLVSS
jgi:uncharacterized protein involved in type VI secretion and phage assembly